MSTASSTDHQTNDRDRAIREVVLEVERRRSEGAAVSDAEVIAEHPSLQPELARELSKLQRIRDAFEELEDKQYAIAWQRLEADSDGRREIGSETDDFDPAASDVHEIPESLSSIGRYQVMGILGEGGFARVYQAQDEELRRDVAIKVPYRRRGTDPDEMEAYWAEARIVAALDHAAIVPVYDVGRTRDGHCYVVSKLIRGENLATRLKRSHLTPDEATHIVLVVADALRYAHSRGLVHRDIKPANILLDAAGRPYVVDFGLALTEYDTNRGRSFAGTPGYMSPEQARGEAHRVDARSDLFSLGLVIYEMLTGQKPFQADSYDALLEQVLWEDPVPMRQWDESIDEELERITSKAMSKHGAADRYASATQLIDDLRHWRRGVASEAASPGTSASTPPATDESNTTELRPKIIPRGLRSFDANDADFFLNLVPGPRDRNGLPESIRQWKSRIEDRDPASAFTVGLVYGPSGCGKSSLIQAGLLPRLSPAIRPIYVQATGDDTEQRLRHRLAHQFPDVPQGDELAETLAAIRRGQGLGQHDKLLLVIDQFEQWLHGRKDKEQRELLAALRQCDGEHVTCLLLVRDDFWLAVGRFMADLEVELVQGVNAALVDLFDVGHARSVLTEFGRAYGQLPDDVQNIDSDQQQFLQQALKGLANEDHVIPVRLALFAEMVKNRDWSPETLRAVGGAEGVGVAFLEETFITRTANPRYRIHQQAVRSVLNALLPNRGSDIRGRICSNSELLDISGYGKRPRQFKELMRILDGETRLLTPMDLDAIDTHDLTTSPGNRYYQLTHDYLVPSLRQWLTAKQKSTRSGRTELRLAERARLWNDRSERRQLPSLLEYASIRAFTRSSGWTMSQQRLMKAARRHHFRSLLLTLLLLATLLLIGGTATSWTRNLMMNVRAHSTVLSMAMGRDAAVWPLLQASPDPTERTEVIHCFSPLVTPPDYVLDKLDSQEDMGIKRGMVLIAGELVGAVDEQTLRSSALRQDDPMAVTLKRIYRNDPDPGMRGAARWTLVRFQQDKEIRQIDSELQSKEPVGSRRWYVNSMGHSLVVVPGWTDFLMGTAPDDPARQLDEHQLAQQIRRSFYLSSQETSAAQFAIFVRETAKAGGPFERRHTIADPSEGEERFPQTEVTWYDAVAYCNWLSAREGILEDQWCYLPNEAGEFGPGMQIAKDAAKKRGYRLPTEAEWEFACRAGTTTTRFFGNSLSRLGQYAACPQNGRAAALQPVCSFKPNGLGLFDMLGNAAEWCHDGYTPQLAAPPSPASSTRTLYDEHTRVLRGGSANDPPARLRSAARGKSHPNERSAWVGFRIARTNL